MELPSTVGTEPWQPRNKMRKKWKTSRRWQKKKILVQKQTVITGTKEDKTLFCLKYKWGRLPRPRAWVTEIFLNEDTGGKKEVFLLSLFYTTIFWYSDGGGGRQRKAIWLEIGLLGNKVTLRERDQGISQWFSNLTVHLNHQGMWPNYRF